ncbi:MAG: hypothetical protein LBB94_03465 [Clostridiales bacterium]|jgi:hypothetical protein|nr:hypothetical protein [Clostridiales bacterium]
MPKASRLGILNKNNFDEKQIYSSGVLDEIQGITVEEHMNDENIHISADDFSRVAFTGDYDDLNNTPDIPKIISNSFIDGGSF